MDIVKNSISFVYICAFHGLKHYIRDFFCDDERGKLLCILIILLIEKYLIVFQFMGK